MSHAALILAALEEERNRATERERNRDNTRTATAVAAFGTALLLVASPFLIGAFGALLDWWLR